jgi:hypothetical protein
MADTTTYAFAGLLLLSVAALAVSARRVLATPKPEARPPDTDSRLVARKVRDETQQVRGETVRIQGEDAVLHGPGGFLVVPKAQLDEAGEDLRAAGVDWARAAERGAAWAKEHEDKLHFDDKGMPITEKR